MARARSLADPLFSVAESMRSLRRDIEYYQAKCRGVDFTRKELLCTWTSEERDASFTLPYDHLVIATGANSNTFGIPGVAKYAHFLKEIEHARSIRRRIIDCASFLRASPRAHALIARIDRL